MASLQVTKNSAMQAQQRGPGPQFSGTGNVVGPKFGETCAWSPEYGSTDGLVLPNPEPNWTMKVENAQLEPQCHFTMLEDDHIEQMIEELLDYGSIEIAI